MYFYLSPIDHKSVAVACAPSSISASYPLIPELVGLRKLPFDLTLKRLSFGKNGSEKSSDLDGLKHLWFDYQPNSLALPIFSERFKNLIDAHAMDKEYLDWIEVKIHQNKKVFRTYYMLKFKQKKDVLNLEKSEFSGRNADFLVKPFFALEKIDNLNIFTIAEDNWQITSHLYVSQEIKAAAKAQSMIGLNFEDVNASRFI